jgi:hypothetical protein
MKPSPRIVRACFHSVVVCLLTSFLALVVAAGPDGVPSGRNKPVAAFDPTRKTIVLFGGFGADAPVVLQDSWEWTDGRWQRLEKSAFPPRAAAGVATDTRRGRVVLFGGMDEAGICGDTLEWDGKAWKRVAWTGPSARSVVQLAYDSKRGRTVMFGGIDDKNQSLGDTWEWDGAQWTKMADSGPPARFQHVMVYNAARGRVVLFGGNSLSGPFDGEAYRKAVLGDTWEWDGTKWTRATDEGPPRRDHHAMAYDEARGKVVMFGGWDGKFLDDIWEWDGTWKKAEARGPSARGGLPSMVYHPTRQSVLLYGGWGDEGVRTDIWKWDGRTWTRIE